MLKKIRIALASVFFAGITLLFLGVGCDWWGWMAKLQFLPAALGLNVAVLAVLVVLTLLFGRVYCSVVCPLGVIQDISGWIRRQLGKASEKLWARSIEKHPERKGKKAPVTSKRFAFSPERKWLRYGVLAVFVISLIAGLQFVVAFLAPYSSYGRVVRSLVSPAAASWPVLVAAAVTFLLAVVLAWVYGRVWCNAICPVGTVLGFFSRFSIFKPHVNTSKCTDCGRCERGCKSSCINSKTKEIDYSRCVACFDCISRCKEGAIELKPSRKASTDNSRRTFLTTTALVAGSLVAEKASAAVQGGFAPVEPKADPERGGRLVPPGASSAKSLYSRCTACQLCVSNCPNGVLKPSTDLQHLMQPYMTYADGWCRPECTACSDLCPAGAIGKLREGEKSVISIGTASVDLAACLSAAGKEHCGNCARHCPTGALRMVESAGREVPVVDDALCIGCGACEHLCPVRPISAVTVKALEKHRRNG